MNPRWTLAERLLGRDFADEDRALLRRIGLRKQENKAAALLDALDGTDQLLEWSYRLSLRAAPRIRLHIGDVPQLCVRRLRAARNVQSVSRLRRKTEEIDLEAVDDTERPDRGEPARLPAARRRHLD